MINPLNKLSIKSKGLIIAAVSAGGLIISAVLGLSALDAITARLQTTAEHSLPAIVRLSKVAGELEAAHLELTRLALWIALEVDTAGTDAQKTRIIEAQVRAEVALRDLIENKSATMEARPTAGLDPAVAEHRPQGRDDGNILSTFEKYTSQTQAAIAMMTLNPAMGTMIVSSAESTFGQLINQVRDLTSFQEAHARGHVATAVDYAHASFWRSAMTMIAFAVASIFLTVLVIGDIIAPIRRIEHFIAKLSGSAEVADMPDADRGDELGRVARTMRDFQESLVRNRRLQQERDELMNSLEIKVAERTQELSAKQTQLEEALAKEHELNAMQRQFVSMVCHEFRTPLAIIDGGAGRLVRRAEKLTADDVGKSTKKIKDAVKRMIRLIESTLAAARMDDGKIVVEPSECDICAVLETCCEAQQELSASHSIKLEMKEIPATIMADPNALDQVFTNLLSNAVKYAPDAPLINVNAWSESDDVVISVADHGVGMDDEDLQKLFQRFFRAKSSTGIAGTGIGLNLVKRLIDQHGGDISVASQLGQGTTFIIRLPIEGADPTMAPTDRHLAEQAHAAA